MAITRKQLKNGKVQISSSYFDDIKVYQMSMRDTGFRERRFARDKFILEQGSELRRASVIETIALWRAGCKELSEFVNSLKEDQLERYETKYMGENAPVDEEGNLLVSPFDWECLKNVAPEKRKEIG